MDRSVVHPCKSSNKLTLNSFLRKAFPCGFLRLIIMEENKNPLESELAEALADVVMDEDNDDKHETFIKRFDTPDEIVQYWEHQLEKVKSC